MELLDRRESEGYYWLCRVARREPGGREALVVQLGGTDATLWDLCKAPPPKKKADRGAPEIAAWLETFRDRDDVDDQELPVVGVLATYVLEGRDADFKDYGAPAEPRQRSWKISDAPEDNPEDIQRTRRATNANYRKPTGNEDALDI